MKTYDNLVVGGGVVGWAIARQLRFSGKNVLVVESLDLPGRVTSSANSGVVHSGIHLDPKSLKSQLALRGSRLIRTYARTHPEIELRNIGMYIAVARGDLLHLANQTNDLLNMHRRAKAIGVKHSFISRKEMAQREPNLDCAFAIYLADPSTINSVAFVESLANEATKLGAEAAYGHKVTGIAADGDAAKIVTDGGEYRAKMVINAAGLNADLIADMAGYEMAQGFCRGEYYEILPSAGISVKSLIYPVHRRGRPGLGVHITPRYDGRLYLGPNSSPVFDDDGECLEANRTPPEKFLEAVRSFLPSLRVEDLRWAFAGVRPMSPTGDFRIELSQGEIPMINLVGIESPGLTASLAIGELVSSMLG